MMSTHLAFLLLLWGLVFTSLPVADAHPDAEGSAGATTSAHLLAQPDLDHADHALPGTDGEHVHFHHCCPHALMQADIGLPQPTPRGGYSNPLGDEQRRPGSYNLPFRPPIV